ncbi:PilW family protein [Saccharospirillum salsuginis]|uniref:Type IV pilus assembly protein PilW n=1 Tax=Saccharospirillum salsuginis TaxID=418750 RepID=A0A918NBA8_9GAMM|nr:PilW family protein [Saccharospirillum salsuginis]GGX55159.1 hypothetical protein GCM10007392_23470 [Saccharospirillum salsuginis]
MKQNTYKYETSVRHVRSAGFTVVELLIALTLALVLMGGVVQVVTTSSSSYGQLVQQGRLQESAKLAMDYITREVRNVGFWGCNGQRIQIANALDKSKENYFDPNDALWGFKVGGTGQPTYASGGDPYEDAVSGSSVLVLRLLDIDSSLQVTGHQVSPQGTGGSAKLELSEEHGYDKGQVFTVVDSDCSNVGIFAQNNANINDTLSIIAHNPGSGQDVTNCTKALKGNFDCDDESGALYQPYSVGSHVYAVRSIAFVLKPVSSGSSINALHLVDLEATSGTNTQLVEGVKSLSIKYGLDTDSDGNVDLYVSDEKLNADSNLDWTMAIAMQVDVTTQGLESVGTLTFEEDFSTVIRLRNRGI